MEDGLNAITGYAVLDDSKSLLIREDGWVETRKNPEEDLYFWGYGMDYLTCIQDFTDFAEQHQWFHDMHLAIGGAGITNIRRKVIAD